EHVERPNLIAMIRDERRPFLPARRTASRGSNMSLHRSLRDGDPEFQELAANALGTPNSVFTSQPVDQRDRARREPRLSVSWMARLPQPESAKAVTMPAEDRFRSHEQNCVPPARYETGEQHE